MKIEIVNYREGNSIIENESIYIYDEEGHQYRICLNKFGEIEIQASDGSLSIEPHVSNEIVLNTK